MARGPLDYLGADDASTSVKGKIQIATSAEVIAGANTTKAVTPATLAAFSLGSAPAASTSQAGIIEIATDAEAAAKALTNRAIVPSNLANIMADPGAIGGTTPAAGSFTTLTASSTVTFTGGVLNLGTDNAANAVNIGVGTTARTISIGNSAAAHVIAIGSSTGAASLTLSVGTGHFVLNGAATSNYTIGAATTSGSITIGGTAQTGTLTLGSSSGTNTVAIGAGEGATTVNIAGGATVGKTVNIATGLVANAVTIGSTSGASSISLLCGTGNFALNGAAASTYTIGAATTSGTITIGGTAQTGTFTLGGSTAAMTMNIANADGVKTINIGSGVSGNTISLGNGINTSAQIINLAGGASAANSTVNILSGNGSAGTQTCNILTGTRAGALNLGSGAAAHVITIGSTSAGAMTIDSSQGISIDAQAASNFTVTGAADLTLSSTAGSVNATAGEAAADAIVLSASAGGIDITAAGAGLDLDLSSSAGSVNITGAEDAADAVVISASAGGIDISATGEAGQDIDITNTGGSVNITATENDLGAIYIHANGGTSERIRIHSDQGTGDGSITIDSDSGGITLNSGTDITVTGTVKEIDAEFLYASGTDLVISQSPIVQSNANTGAAPTGSAGDVNLLYMQDGCLMEQFIIGTQTIIAPRMTANGLSVGLDTTLSDGVEYNFGARSNAKHVYTIGTDAPFFAQMTFYIQDLSECQETVFGFRKVEANQATFGTYTDYVAIGMNGATSATNVVIYDELNSGGTTITDTTDAWGGDGAAQTLSIEVATNGVVTFKVNGSAASAAPSFTFDNTDEVMFFFRQVRTSGNANEISWQNLKIGYQA